MAEAFTMRYILNKRYSNITRLMALSLFIGIAMPTVASAQTTLQGASNGLQQQTGQAQTSVNTQNQVGTLQNNDGSALSQNGTKSLSVVSNPNQTKPDVTVGTSNTLTASVTEKKHSNNVLIWVAIISAIGAAIGIITLWTRSTTKIQDIEAEVPAVRPEPIKPQKKSRQKRNNKKKSRKQR